MKTQNGLEKTFSYVVRNCKKKIASLKLGVELCLLSFYPLSKRVRLFTSLKQGGAAVRKTYL